MKRTRRSVAALAVTLALASPIAAQRPDGPGDLSLTVYSGDLGLVRRSVPVQLGSGSATIRVDDLPANMDPSTLLVAGDGVALLGVHDIRRYQASGSAGALSLELDLDVVRATDRLPLVFLTNGLTWSADYAVVVAPDDASASLNAYVTLRNTSGAEYENAHVQLLAGTIQRDERGAGRGYIADELMRVEAEVAPSIEQAAFADYHLYSLDSPVTLRNDEGRRLRLLGSGRIAVSKRYVLRGDVVYAGQQAEPQSRPVAVGYSIRRSGDRELDREPLPAGTARVYQPDASGRLQLLGLTAVSNTPRGEDLWLATGNAFDVIATRTQTDFERVGGSVYESAWRVDLVNRTETSVEVEVIESLGGDWEILSSSHDPEKLSARSVRFRVPVPADGKAQLEYRVSVRP